MSRPTRKVITRREYARRGLISLVAIGLLLSLVWLRSSGTFGGDPHVSARLADAGGSLTSGADVKVRGVIVGKVDSIDRAPGGGVEVRISMPADDLRMVPDNVVARILPATVFGTSYVDLALHGKPSDEGLRADALIPADSTQGTLELQQALDDIDSLVKAVGPAELASAIGSAAQALDGRGITLGKTIDRANAYLAKLNPKLPLLREDIDKLADNLELAEDVLPDYLTATDDALTTARTIAAEQASLVSLISGGTTLAARAEKSIKANRANLIRFVRNSAALLEVVYANRHAGIAEALATNKLLGEKLPSIFRHGFLNARTNFVLNPPAYYTAADCPQYGAAKGDNCSGSSRVGLSAMVAGR